MQRGRLLKAVICVTLVLVLGVALPLTSGCAARPKPEIEVQPIKVGVPWPMTGPYASDGMNMIQTGTLAVEEINAAGGLCGRPLVIVDVDTKEMTPEDVSLATEILIGAGVDVVACDYAGVTVDIPTFGKYDVPYLNWTDSRSAQSVWNENPELYWNLIHIGANGEAYGVVPFKVITEVLPYEHPNKKIALLTMDADWSVDISNDIRRLAAEDPEWEIVIDEMHPYGNTEYGTQLIKIREEKPTLIYFSTYTPSEAVSFINQFHQNPTDSLIYIPYTPVISEFMDLLSEEELEGLLWGSQTACYGTPEQNAYKERFRQRWGREHNDACTYDCIMYWAEAVKRVGDPSDYRAIVQDILTHPYEGILGTYDIDPETNWGKPGHPQHRFYQIHNGEHVILYLDESPYGEGEFEVPPWIGD